MTDTGSNADIEAVDDVYNEIMYHVLGQFLVTKDNKNVATIFEELVNEFKNTQEIKSTLQELTQEIKTMNNELREIKTFYSSALASAPLNKHKNEIIEEKFTNNLKLIDNDNNANTNVNNANAIVNSNSGASVKGSISSSLTPNIVSSVSAEMVANS